MTSGLPSYDELPVTPGAPAGSSWGLWGDDDRFGCLNLLKPDAVLRAAQSIRTGRVFPLNLELELPDPPLFGRSRLRHHVTGEAGRSHDDVLSDWNTQASSQWDGFRHVAHPEHGYYGGLDDEEHGIDHWARRGIVGRGVLVDVARWRQATGDPLDIDSAEPITADDIVGTLGAQRTTVEPGDILMLRTGWLQWYRSLDADGRAALAEDFSAPGLEASEATCRMLWDMHVAAVAADNPAVETWPAGAGMDPAELERIRTTERHRLPEVFVHTALLPLLGIPLGELWDLDGLAADCAADDTYDCFLTSAPLNLRNGVASPPNALAIR